MSLKELCGKRIRIVSPDGASFTGKVSDYFYPEDNENEKESVVLDTEDGTLIEIYEDDIKELEIISR